MISYKYFVKTLQCILVFGFAMFANMNIKEDAGETVEDLMIFFPVLIIMIEAFRGDDL